MTMQRIGETLNVMITETNTVTLMLAVRKHQSNSIRMGTQS